LNKRGIKMDNELKILKKFFETKPQIVMAFLFGSRATGQQRNISDWDIGIYFKPVEYMELEANFEYPEEEKIWGELVEILQTDNIDLVVLNRASPDLVYKILRDGLPLKISDKKLYLNLLCKVSYEAMDWWKFVDEYYWISEKAKSISPENKAEILKYLRFLENEFTDIEIMKNITWQEYNQNSIKRRALERWIENLVMGCLDISKIILASEKKTIPQSYKETLKVFCTVLGFSPEEAEEFSALAQYRNIVVHEYLDIRWRRMQKFILLVEKLFPTFLERVKKVIKNA